MVKVAIAGGAGNLGTYIVKAILEAGRHTPIILSRSSKPSSLEAEVRVVDYSDHSSLVSALDGVHTVIVTLFSTDVKESVDNQLALLKAAQEVGVKRFAPSEWGSRDHSEFYMYHPKMEVWDVVKTSGLEVTRFVTGLYIDMFVGPGKLFIDTLAGTAKIPGDGTAKTTFTYTPDIGQFVAASLDLERWDEVSGIVGETKTWDEAVDIAEVVTGKKFERTYMKEGGGEAAKQLLERKFLAGLTKSVVAGHWEVEPTLNRKFPQLRAFTVEEYLRQSWKGTN
ncbi:NAD-P-binding protein [Stereum hirsutum FP-91666 SS1]|uniref:NAD-P-binding protein n=1 Tax=Stereum hirsutum (strain FP-91666) TaxID=721885 RepID=UPI000444A58F|nr:NAD-P-binding protein [Stereum hirsutum FP-91666 SS1]EIM86313.1 NAD-P-binding protein [Stereum hirsutum FP-91666 SS1]